MINVIAKFERSKLCGTVSAPPSKSMAHRYLICAALSNGESRIKNIELSEDIKATINCLNALGAEITFDAGTAFVQGIKEKRIINPLCCNESGSTLRFLVPYAMSLNEKVIFSGCERLFERPLEIYEKIAEKNHFVFEKDKKNLTVQGDLNGDEFTLPGNVSSQFISGLLFVLPLLKKDSVIKIVPPFESKPYILLTLNAIKKFGVDIFYDGEHIFNIKGNQSYTPANTCVEGDFSNGAYLAGLNYGGNSVRVLGLDEKSLQGDKVYKDFFNKLESGFAHVDISDCPDLGPVLFAVAALNNGGEFVGTKRLEIKESNRAEAMAKELSKLGVKVEKYDNKMIVFGADISRPTSLLHGYNDHRIVMALSILLTITGGEIDDAESVRKSFPNYFEQVKKLGAKVSFI